MNLERGTKRITLVVSVAAGLGAWVWSSAALFDHWYWEREEYLSYKEKYENIELFWQIWDANGWNTGQRGTLRALVADHGMKFTSDGRTFTLYRDDVLPGIDGTIAFPPGRGLEGLSPALVATIEKARAGGANKALLDYVYAETFWTKRTGRQLLAFSIIFGLSIGTWAFIAMWLLFLLFRWISHGFFADVGETNKIPTGAATAVVVEVADADDSRPSSQELVSTRMQ